MVKLTFNAECGGRDVSYLLRQHDVKERTALGLTPPNGAVQSSTPRGTFWYLRA